MSEPCPHLEVLVLDSARFERGYYASGRERADLIAAIQQLRVRAVLLEHRATGWKEAAREYRRHQRETAAMVLALVHGRNAAEDGLRQREAEIDALTARIADLEQRQRSNEIAALREVMAYARHRPGCGAEQRPELRCQCGFARALSDAVRRAWRA